MMGTNTARAFWIREPGRGEIRTEELAPRPEGEGLDDEVLVRALYSGISRGTEALVFRGEVPPSQYEAMRAPFQGGRFPGPVKYGYTSVGQVEAAPAPDLVGRTVFCLHPHQDRYRVPAEAVTALPDDLPPERAVLAAYMETAVNGVWDGSPTVGDRIVVVGAGVLGLLVAWLCRRIPGTRVAVVDVHPARGSVARSLGLTFVSEAPPDGSADLVYHASGTREGLQAALEAAGREAAVVELSWYGLRAVELPLGEAFHTRRLQVRSSQVGALPPHRAPRWDRGRRLRLALELLRDGRLDALVSGESAFDELPEVMARLSRSPGDTLCHRIRYPTT